MIDGGVAAVALHDRETASTSVSTENAARFEEGVITIRANARAAVERAP